MTRLTRHHDVDDVDRIGEAAGPATSWAPGCAAAGPARLRAGEAIGEGPGAGEAARQAAALWAHRGAGGACSGPGAVELQPASRRRPGRRPGAPARSSGELDDDDDEADQLDDDEVLPAGP